MINHRSAFFVILTLFLFVYTAPCIAEGVYSTPKGKVVKKYPIQRIKKKEEPPAQKETTQKKTATKKMAVTQKKTPITKKRTLSAKEKMNAEAVAAFEAGYKVGQRVKVKDGIIYRLAKDPKTGAYTFKRYRLVKKKKTVAPETVAAEANVKALAEADAKEKAAAQARAEAEVKAREEAAEKARTETGEKRKKEERTRKEKAVYASENMMVKGRNLKRLKASVSYRHSFVDTKTVITDRTLTTSDGETTTTVPVTDGVGQEDTYYTDTHKDMVRLRLGITDSVELFVDAGVAYDQLSNMADMEPVFGGGFRVNILEVDDGLFSGGYLAFSGEYLKGKLKMDYSDAGGSEYHKTTDWQDMTATLESGVVFSRFTIFAGCSYFMYSESMTKKQIQPPPDINMLEDELEQQGNINLSGGFEYHYSPSLHFLLEAQAPNRLGGLFSFEYRF